jgi:hypothetical protein
MSFTRLAQIFILSVFLVFIVWILAATIHWINRPKETVSGRVLAQQDWPESLVELLKNAEKRHINVEQLKVYCGPHDDFFWKCDATPELLNLMITRWKLSSVNRDYNVINAVLQIMPPAISSLGESGDVVYYVSAEYLPGGFPKGHLYCVMNNKTDKVLVVHYYYNF